MGNLLLHRWNHLVSGQQVQITDGTLYIDGTHAGSVTNHPHKGFTVTLKDRVVYDVPNLTTAARVAVEHLAHEALEAELYGLAQ